MNRANKGRAKKTSSARSRRNVSGGMDHAVASRMSEVLGHRLKNHAAGIRNAVTLLQEEFAGELSASGREFFPLILRECGLIDDSATRMRLAFGPAPDAFPMTLGAVTESAMRDAGADGEKVVVSMAEDVAVRRVQHGTAFCHAVREVIRNAVEAVKHGAVEIDVVGDAGIAKCRVSDKGSGLAEKVRAGLFTPFCTTKSRHLGLGLWIANRMIAVAGGTIDIGENECSGATVLISAPFCDDATAMEKL